MRLIKIRDAYAYGGPAYEVPSEDGPIATFSYLICAEAADGRRFTHNTAFRRAEQERAERFAARIREAGEIDPAHWVEVETITTEDRFAAEVEREQMDRAGYDVSYWGSY